MPPKRGYGKKKMPKKGKKSMRQYKRKSRLIKSQSGQTMKYNNALTQYHRARKTVLTSTYFSPASAISYVYNPTVGAMPDLANYTALFTHFRIESFSVTFRWVDDGTQAGVDLQTVQQPVLNICFNDDGNLSTVTSTVIGEKRNVVQHTFTAEKSVFTYTFYPKTISPIYYSSVASGYKLNKKEWIDCDYSATPHYGIAVYIDQLPVGTRLNVDHHYDVSFKSQK